MKIYIFKVDEYTFLSSFYNESILLQNKNIISQNDYILFLIDDKIAGLSSIHTIIEKSEETRLGLTFEVTFLKENQVSIYSAYFDNIFNSIEKDSFDSLSEIHSNIILEKINNMDSDFGFYLVNIDSLLEEAKELRDIEKKRKFKLNENKPMKAPEFKNYDEHQKAQFLINEIGSICKLNTWTATNDKNRNYKGVKLGSLDTTNFPELDIPVHSQHRIELIDNIWIKDKRPICAFEVESSTPIYSGLLRLADIATVLSTSNLHLFIVAPRTREKKFLNEIQRPLFKSINLEKFCHFIPIDSLEALYEKIKGLDGYIDYKVLDVIKLSTTQLEERATMR